VKTGEPDTIPIAFAQADSPNAREEVTTMWSTK